MFYGHILYKNMISNDCIIPHVISLLKTIFAKRSPSFPIPFPQYPQISYKNMDLSIQYNLNIVNTHALEIGKKKIVICFHI